MQLKRLDHINVETNRPEDTIRFYEDVLGFVNSPERRPALAPPGTWLFLDDDPVVHVNFVVHDSPGNSGTINHVAFEGSGYTMICSQLDDLGISYRTVESPRFHLQQIYVKDPNGLMIEINIRGEIGDAPA